MDVHAKRQEQQARYESLAQTRSHDADGYTSTRLEAMRLIHSKIMDYKHEHPANLRKTIELLLKLCQNICDAPDDPRFRKVARSPVCAAFYLSERYECRKMPLWVLLRIHCVSLH